MELLEFKIRFLNLMGMIATFRIITGNYFADGQNMFAISRIAKDNEKHRSTTIKVVTSGMQN